VLYLNADAIKTGEIALETLPATTEMLRLTPKEMNYCRQCHKAQINRNLLITCSRPGKAGLSLRCLCLRVCLFLHTVTLLVGILFNTGGGAALDRVIDRADVLL